MPKHPPQHPPGRRRPALHRASGAASGAATGAAMEAAACRFLQGQGLRLLDRNWRCRLGELDLVMRDANTLVFVEVRCRRQRGRPASSGYGDGLASVHPGKQQRLLRAARHWLMLHPAPARQEPPPCRFDVVAVDSLAGEPVFRWVRDAFSA